MIKTYSELSRLFTFAERFRYLKLDGAVGQDTFGFDRYLNQLFYRSQKWKAVRNLVLIGTTAVTSVSTVMRLAVKS